MAVPSAGWPSRRFISNVPEALSSSEGMKRAGRSAGYIFAIWGAIAVASDLAAITGYTFFERFPAAVVAATTATAAGAILAMLVDTTIPEAFTVARDSAELVTVGGFLVSFMLSKLGG